MAEKTVVFGNTDDASYQSGTIASANQDCTLARESDKQNLEQLAQEILALKQASLENANNHHREMQKLRGYLRWLTGILLVAILGLGGSFIGVTYSLRNEQNKIAQQVESIADNQVSIQQFEQLKTLINSLNQQAKELSKRTVELSQQVPQVSLNQLEAIREQLQTLEVSIRENVSNAVITGQLKQLNEILSRALQTQTNQPSSPPSSDPLPENTPIPNSTSSEAVGGSTDGLNPSP